MATHVYNTAKCPNATLLRWVEIALLPQVTFNHSLPCAAICFAYPFGERVSDLATGPLAGLAPFSERISHEMLQIGGKPI